MHSRAKHKDTGSWDPNLGESAVRTRWVEKENGINFRWILRQTLKSCISRDLSWDGNMERCKAGAEGGFSVTSYAFHCPFLKKTTLKPKAKQRFSKMKPTDDVNARTQFTEEKKKRQTMKQRPVSSPVNLINLSGLTAKGAHFHLLRMQ